MITFLWDSSVIVKAREFIKDMFKNKPKPVVTNSPYRTSKPRVLTTDNGIKLRIESLIGSGGQGEVYRAFFDGNAEPVALKLFYRSQSTTVTKERIRFLVKKRLDQIDRGICAPFDTITGNGLVGHIAPFAHGKTLLEFLEEGSLSYSEVYAVALQIVDLVRTLIEHGIIQGDLQTQNIKLHRTRQGIYLYMIDFDNYSAVGAKKPSMLGMTLYIAPELRKKRKNANNQIPTEYTDRFSLGVLMHEVLLHFHPIAGFDETVDDINASMVSNWKYDPSLPNTPKNPHGYPVSTLNPELTAMLRRSLSPMQQSRPSYKEWQQALETASANLLICENCGIPMVNYMGRTKCPSGHHIQRHILRLDSHNEIYISGMVSVLGRRELGGSSAISGNHIVIREIGSQLYVEAIGMNPTYIRQNGSWRSLVPNKLIQLKPNDQLMVADRPIQYKTLMNE